MTSVNEPAWVRGRRRFRQNTKLSRGVFATATFPETCLERSRKPLRIMSFRETRKMLLIDGNIISDDEFSVLWESYRSKNPDFPHSSYARFDLQNIDEAECLVEFRVQKQHIPVLANVLQLPVNIQCPQRTICNRVEGLCMLLKRFSYPCRYSDMISRFGRPVPELCMITNEVMDNIFNNHSHRISQWNRDVLSSPLLQEYADAKGSPVENCFGFIDGAVRRITRPNQQQRIVYNGHKRVRSLKFQSVALPNRLIGNMYGPVDKLLMYIVCHINFTQILTLEYFILWG